MYYSPRLFCVLCKKITKMSPGIERHSRIVAFTWKSKIYQKCVCFYLFHIKPTTKILPSQSSYASWQWIIVDHYRRFTVEFWWTHKRVLSQSQGRVKERNRPLFINVRQSPSVSSCASSLFGGEESFFLYFFLLVVVVFVGPPPCWIHSMISLFICFCQIPKYDEE